MNTLTLTPQNGDESFTFDGIFESPEFINRGGTQNIAVHDLIGGVRIADAMGRINDDIAWTGSFLGITAEEEAEYLKYLMTQGNPLTLTWGMFQFLVLIKDFKPVTYPNYLVNYSITCLVIEDQTQPVTIAVPSAFDETLLNDLIEAEDLATLAANPSVSSALAIANAAITAAVDVGGFNTGELAAASAAASSTVTAITQALSAFGGGFGFSASAIQPPATELAQAVVALEAQWKKYQALEQLLNTATRIQRNIQIALLPNGTQLVMVVNQDLFHLALTYYGDALQWTVIAEANEQTLQNEEGFVIPFIYGMKQLFIPPKPSAPSNGIMNYQ